MSDKPLDPNSGLPNKKTIYHSELRAACEQQPEKRLAVRFKSPVMKSQRGGYVHALFEAAGDPIEHDYRIENDEIAGTIKRMPKNDLVWIQAAGGRGTETLKAWPRKSESQPADQLPSANLRGETTGGSQAATPAATKQQEQRHSNGNGNAHAARQWVQPEERTAIADEMEAALHLAHDLFERFQRKHGRYPLTEEWAAACSMFIQQQNHDGRRPWGVVKERPVRDPLQAMASSAAAPRPYGGTTSAAPAARATAGVGAPSSPFEADDDDLPF